MATEYRKDKKLIYGQYLSHDEAEMVKKAIEMAAKKTGVTNNRKNRTSLLEICASYIEAIEHANHIKEHAAKGLATKLEQADRLNAENERLSNALEYIYESGSLLNEDVVEKARWGLGFEVENEKEIAALKPRFS